MFQVFLRMRVSSRSKIAVIVVYFGTTPWYLSYFFHSCKYNPSIDFLIFTDQKGFRSDVSKNVLVKQMTFREFIKLLSVRLKLEIDFDIPYKICDFRPAFGVVFEDYLKGYDFWAHADADVIFGNIRKFVTPVLLEKYDIISMRHDYILGCFTLFRNCTKVNLLYTFSSDYIKVFTSERHFCFDETNFSFAGFLDGQHYSKVESEVESMTHLVRRMQNIGYVSAYFDFHIIEGRPGKLKWHRGSLLYRNKFEVILYHLIRLKKIYQPLSGVRRIGETFRISPSRIY